MAKKSKGEDARDWWLLGLILLGLGVGGLFRSVARTDTNDLAFTFEGFAFAAGLYLVITSAVARAVQGKRSDDPS